MAEATLRGALRAPSPTLMIAAIEAVERLQLEALAPPVLELLGSPSDRIAAAAAIAVLRAHPQAPHLATELLRSDDPQARAIVAAGIGRKVGERARADLVPLLADPDPTVRAAAVGAVRDARLDSLAALALRDPAPLVRTAALAALRRSDASRARRRRIALQALTDPYLGARLAAVAVLAAVDAQPELAALASGQDIFVALRAAVALDSQRAKDAYVPLLERALTAPSWPMRAAALNAADGIARRSAALRLVSTRLHDSSAEVRLATARALASLGMASRARQALRAELEHRDPVLRARAAAELVRLQQQAREDEASSSDAWSDAKPREVLSRLAQAPAIDARRAAIAGHRRAAVITPGLIAALADSAAELRIEAAEVVLEQLR